MQGLFRHYQYDSNTFELKSMHNEIAVSKWILTSCMGFCVPPPLWIINEINTFHIFEAEVLIKGWLIALHSRGGLKILIFAIFIDTHV